MATNKIQELVNDLEAHLRNSEVRNPEAYRFGIDTERGMIHPVRSISRKPVCELEIERVFFVVSADAEAQQVEFQKSKDCGGTWAWTEEELNDFRTKCDTFDDAKLLNAAGYLDLGWVYAWRGDEEQARKMWGKGKELATDNPAVRNKLVKNLGALPQQPPEPSLPQFAISVLASGEQQLLAAMQEEEVDVQLNEFSDGRIFLIRKQ